MRERMVEGHARVRHELEDVEGVAIIAHGEDAEDGTPAPAVLLGDVSGHGRESVTQAALARYTLRTLLADRRR